MSPGSPTDALTSAITLSNYSYVAGEYMNFLIEARDQYGNLRTASTSEVFNVTLACLTTSTSTSLSYISNNNGTYTVN